MFSIIRFKYRYKYVYEEIPTNISQKPRLRKTETIHSPPPYNLTMNKVSFISVYLDKILRSITEIIFQNTTYT